MPRYKCILEYDGSFFCGWQAQPMLCTVQSTIESAAQKLTGGFPVQFFAAGRTDKGVHAIGQVAHADFPVGYTLDSIRRGLNFYLKDYPVIVVDVESVDDQFHARFDAQFRLYQYRILNRPSPVIINRGRVWWVARPLNGNLMAQGAQCFIGKHDFSSFRSTDCQARCAIKTIDTFHLKQIQEEIILTVQSRSFLHNQVRLMVGALKWIGEGRWSLENLYEALSQKIPGLLKAPAHGLTLMKVGYANQ